MTLSATIQPRVGQSLITRVTRLYNGTLFDCLAELLQNSRRAGATRVEIDTGTLGGWPALVIRDDGSGIDDPAKVLTLGESGWGAETAQREDPAGMGIFSLAGRYVAIRSHSQAANSGWEVLIPDDAWQGGVALSVRPCSITAGTEIAVVLPETWIAALNSAVLDAARHYPLPVWFQGVEAQRQDFLDGASHIEEWQGCRIGVFKKYGSEPKDTPRINFHGVTVPCQSVEVQELRGNTWSARVDIIDAPALQLVLPARKEMVHNDALAALRIAMEGAIYRSLAAVGEHRLPFSDWQRARQFGVTLPEAAAWLESWSPSQADNNDWLQSHRLQAEGTIIVPCREADLEQAAAPVIGNAALLGAQAACCEAAFEGYGWYDRLPRITAIDFTFEQGGESWAYGDSAAELLPVGMTSGRVSNLHLDLTITPSGANESQPEVRTFDIDVLAAGNDAYSLDDAIVLIAEGARVELGELVDLMERALFCACDDCDSDSWETQHRYFVSEARNIAATLLFGEEEALIVALREVVQNHLMWRIPQGRRLSFVGSAHELSLSLDTVAVAV